MLNGTVPLTYKKLDYMIHNCHNCFTVTVINIKLCNYFDIKCVYKLDNVFLQI